MWAVTVGGQFWLGYEMQFSLFSPDDNDDDSDNGGNDKHYGNEYDDFADGEPFALKAPEK